MNIILSNTSIIIFLIFNILIFCNAILETLLDIFVDIILIIYFLIYICKSNLSIWNFRRRLGFYFDILNFY